MWYSLMQKVIMDGKPLNEADTLGYSFLHYAALEGNIEVIAFMFRRALALCLFLGHLRPRMRLLACPPLLSSHATELSPPAWMFQDCLLAKGRVSTQQSGASTRMHATRSPRTDRQHATSRRGPRGWRTRWCLSTAAGDAERAPSPGLERVFVLGRQLGDPYRSSATLSIKP
jgi:hypothetical protein